MKTYFTSDTHYNHKNIVKGATAWEGNLDRCRDFETMEEHNNVLVSNINSVVKKDDILYHLGDWSFGGIEQIWNFRKQLICKNVHLILGNHDHHIENNRTLPNVKRRVDTDPHIVDMPKDLPKIFINGNWYYEADNLAESKRHYKTLEPRSNVRAKDLFSSVQYYRELSVGGKRFILCHYAMRVWNKSHHGSIMLYGHSHGTLDALKPEFTSPTWIGDDYFIKNYKTMDVGVDTNNMMPYSLEKILSIMEGKDMLLNIDHHSKDTN